MGYSEKEIDDIVYGLARRTAMRQQQARLSEAEREKLKLSEAALHRLTRKAWGA